MKAEELFQLIGEADEKKVQETILPVKRNHKALWIKASAAAACLCAVLATGAVAAEAHAYNEAVEFFREYGLSTDGLTRPEIKAVYYDIKTGTYSYFKTAEAIWSNQAVEFSGTEIAQEEPSPEDIARLWEQVRANENSGIHYNIQSFDREDETLGFSVHDRSVLQKYDGNQLLWSVSFTEFYIEQWTPVSSGILVWGFTPTWSSQQPSSAWLAKVDDEGSLLWKRELSHGFEHESIAGILENADGSYAVFSRGDLKDLVLSRYSSDGTEISSKKTEVGNVGIWNMARLGEDYLVQLGNRSTDVERIVRVDQEGNVGDRATDVERIVRVDEEGNVTGDYYITDMAEFAGKLYLSAYSAPRPADGKENIGGRYDIAAVLKYIFDNDQMKISSEELLALLRDHYTAVLLVCDPDTGTPQTFYSVQGSLGGKLTADGELLWNVESFANALFSPYTSAWSIRADCQIFRYSFDEDGTLLRQEKTDEVTEFYR